MRLARVCEGNLHSKGKWPENEKQEHLAFETVITNGNFGSSYLKIASTYAEFPNELER